MILPDGLMPAPWAAVGWGIVLAATAFALRVVWLRYRAGLPLLGPRRFAVHAWFATVIALAIVWQIAFRTENGIVLHYLGALIAVAMFGPLGAGLAMIAAQAVVTLNAAASWENFGLNALLIILWPVFFAGGWMRIVHRLLPHHMFVYIFANGFFGAGATVMATSAMTAALLAAGSSQAFAYMGENWVVSTLLMAFSEAWLSGMLITLLVVYRPRWVTSFDDREYMLNK